MTQREQIEPLISGIVMRQLRQINDQRGAVLHMMRNDSPGFTKFGECYFSEVRPGAVKAWKLHKFQTQNLAVPVGRLRFVIYDGRDKSPTYNRLQVLELGRPDAYSLLTIPPGIWYGFMCTSEECALLANCADLPHDPDESQTLPVTAEEIPYQWGQERDAV